MPDPSPVAADEHAIATLQEAIAEVVPDRECIVWRDRRLTWAQVTDRSRRLANALLDRGVGGPVDHATGAPGWVSPHDHVALYLTNGNEYLEAMLGAWKAGAAATNVNYRYTAEELAFVLGDAAAVAVVYHARFAPVLAEALAHVPTVRTLVVVDDGSGIDPVEGSVGYEELLADASGTRPDVAWSPDDRYVVYTGGTTGNPKGVLWRQGDFLHTALGIRGTRDELVERARRPGRPRALPAPPFMHGAAHWNALSCLLAGGTVVIQHDTEHLDAADVLDTCEREQVGSLLIVGDAFARPLLDEVRRRRRDLSPLRALMTGGAVLSPAIKSQLVAELPGLRIVDILGSSETGRHGLSSSAAGDDAEPGVFAPSDTTVVLDEARARQLEPGDPASGWLAQRGRVPLGYLGDEAKTRATFPRIDGVVHAVAGDRARLRSDGNIELLGRDSVTINTGGEKVHAEEVEQALKAHPGVYDALVVGRPSERWGTEIVAVVAADPGSPALDTDAIRAAAGEHLARYKLPKAFVVVDRVQRSASGKPDYAWARRVATEGGLVRRAVVTRPRTYLRKPSVTDAEEFVARVAGSDHLAPWVFPPTDVAAFRQWLVRGERPEVEQYLVCSREDDGIAGFVNLNGIQRGAVQRTTAGWSAFAPYVGRGHLSDAVSMAIEVAFTQLRLHRFEADIQPGNERSRAVARRCGLRLEGYSPRLVLVDGEWRDHERWATDVEDWRAARRR